MLHYFSSVYMLHLKILCFINLAGYEVQDRQVHKAKVAEDIKTYTYRLYYFNENMNQIHLCKFDASSEKKISRFNILDIII